MGLNDLLSLSNLVVSAPFKTNSGLLQEENKHDFVRPEAMTMSIAASNM
jgi:hypothetical protein